jgi:hypothetical protein
MMRNGTVGQMENSWKQQKSLIFYVAISCNSALQMMQLNFAAIQLRECCFSADELRWILSGITLNQHNDGLKLKANIEESRLLRTEASFHYLELLPNCCENLFPVFTNFKNLGVHCFVVILKVGFVIIFRNLLQ